MAKKRGRKPYSRRKFYKRRYHGNRDHTSLAYTNWRDEVKKRDGYMCQWPGCKCRKNLEVHHIKTWSNNAGLRYVVANGITLCRKCHLDIKGKEQDFESFFLKILEWKMLDKIKRFCKKKDN